MNQPTVIIAGSGRSGTTWVQDCIAQANGLRTIFEPLHPVGVPEAEKYAFKYRDASFEDPDLNRFMGRVLSGTYRSIWMNYRVRPDRFNFFRVGVAKSVFNARRFVAQYREYHGKGSGGLIVKFIRANLMLPWIVNHYGLKTLLVTRHPCAVIASRLKLGGNEWTSQIKLDRYRADPAVAALILEQFDVDITESFSPIASLACEWCVENILPANWANEAGYCVSSYERLMHDSGSEWKRVIDFLGLGREPDSDILSLPSQQAPRHMQATDYSGSHLGRWRNALSSDQIKQVSSVLGRFSCSLYSVDDDFAVGSI